MSFYIIKLLIKYINYKRSFVATKLSFRDNSVALLFAIIILLLRVTQLIEFERMVFMLEVYVKEVSAE